MGQAEGSRSRRPYVAVVRNGRPGAAPVLLASLGRRHSVRSTHPPVGPNGRNDHTHRHMFLRASPRRCRRRAGPRVSLSLSRLSEAHRQRLRRAGALAQASIQNGRGNPHLASHRRRRDHPRLPLLPALRLYGVVYAGRSARAHRGRGWCFRRSELSGPGPLTLRDIPSPVGRVAGRDAAVVARRAVRGVESLYAK